ncbi:MAG: SWIB/MDM2 domain-containing protein [Bacteriovoracales bacterium]
MAKKKKATTKKKMAAKPKKTTAKKAKRKPNAAFMKAMTPSADLAKIVGEKPMPRTEAIKRIWAYIKKNKLQNPKNMRNILADENLKVVFGGKKEVTMFQLAGIVGKNLK